MADDPIINPNDVKMTDKALGNLNATISDGLKDLTKYSNTMMESFGEADSNFKKIVKSIDSITKKIRPSIKEFDKFGKITDEAEKSVKNFTKSYTQAFYAGNKQSMLASATYVEHTLNMRNMSRQVQITSQKMRDLSSEFKKQIDSVKNASDHITKFENKQQKLNDIIKNGGKLNKNQQKDFERNTIQIKYYSKEMITAKATSDNLGTASLALTDQLKKEQLALIESSKNLAAKTAAERQENREIRQMAGGLDAVRAEMEGIIESKFADVMKGITAGTLMTSGFAKIVKGLTQTSDYMIQTSRLALSLGDTTQVGFGRMDSAAVELTESLRQVGMVGAKLGYTFEEMEATMDKVRSGIRMDRDGRLTADAIRSMSEEAAYFARISGMEMSETVELMNTRVKRYGMTGLQAAADLEQMRTTIVQMTAADKGNTIQMDQMVRIIEEASAASQSYVVDTRIMTESLRSAVNQAENLGVAQKQATDVAKGVGKILSSTPDFIKIPAGFNLVEQLTGKDADEFLADLDDGTKKQARHIQDLLKRNKISKYAAANVLMDLIGTDKRGLEAQAKQIEQTILGGPNSAIILAHHFHIENKATAQLIVDMMQDAMEIRKKMAASKSPISFSTAFVKDAAMVKAEIIKIVATSDKDIEDLMNKEGISADEAKSRIIKSAQEALRMQGLNDDQIKEWETAYNKAAEIQKQLDDDRDGRLKLSIEKRAELEEKLSEIGTKKQILMTEQMLHPVEDILSRINKTNKAATGAAYKGQTDFLTADDFKSIGITNNKELAKALGRKYEDLPSNDQKTVDTMMKNGKVTAEQLKQFRLKTATATKATEKAADVRFNNELSATTATFNLLKSYLGYGGPLFNAITGIVSVLGGGVLLMLGIQELTLRSILAATLAKEGGSLLDAATKGGGGGGGGSGGGSGGGGWKSKLGGIAKYAAVTMAVNMATSMIPEPEHAKEHKKEDEEFDRSLELHKDNSALEKFNYYLWKVNRAMASVIDPLENFVLGIASFGVGLLAKKSLEYGLDKLNITSFFKSKLSTPPPSSTPSVDAKAKAEHEQNLINAQKQMAEDARQQLEKSRNKSIPSTVGVVSPSVKPVNVAPPVVQPIVPKKPKPKEEEISGKVVRHEVGGQTLEEYKKHGPLSNQELEDRMNDRAARNAHIWNEANPDRHPLPDWVKERDAAKKASGTDAGSLPGTTTSVPDDKTLGSVSPLGAGRGFATQPSTAPAVADVKSITPSGSMIVEFRNFQQANAKSKKFNQQVVGVGAVT